MTPTLMVALVNAALRAAGLEHRARYASAEDGTVDDEIELVEVEDGVPVGIQLSDGRFAVNRYERDDDGEVEAVTEEGLFGTLGGAAARAVAVLLGGVDRDR